jgi:hypothetical protein
MARSVLEEWRLAHSLEEFRVWLEQGAPSDDAKDEKTKRAAVAMTEDFADPSPVVGKVGGRQSRRHG